LDFEKENPTAAEEEKAKDGPDKENKDKPLPGRTAELHDLIKSKSEAKKFNKEDHDHLKVILSHSYFFYNIPRANSDFFSEISPTPMPNNVRVVLMTPFGFSKPIMKAEQELTNLNSGEEDF